MNNKVWLTQEELAERWRKSPRTLANYRAQGKGPAYSKMGGKVLYDLQVVEETENQSRIEPVTS
jgi:hypothetical protein|tara:strand:+ start:464 stop:655 length:192 start_codon:yes stop_codon:yes gene_type:complete